MMPWKGVPWIPGVFRTRKTSTDTPDQGIPLSTTPTKLSQKHGYMKIQKNELGQYDLFMYKIYLVVATLNKTEYPSVLQCPESQGTLRNPKEP